MEWLQPAEVERKSEPFLQLFGAKLQVTALNTRRHRINLGK